MDELIEVIRTACATGATDEAKKHGASACRTILVALEAKEGDPLASQAPSAPGTETAAPPIGAIVGALRGMPPEQLLDLAIARLRAALPKDAAVPAVEPLRFQLIPIAPLAATTSPRKGNA